MQTKIRIFLTNSNYVDFDDDSIISANVTKNYDPMCFELRTGTLECEIYSSSDIFNLLNPNGIYDRLTKNKKIQIWTIENNVEYSIGVYYLKEWSYEMNKTARLYAEDILSLLEEKEFIYEINCDNNGSRYYTHELIANAMNMSVSDIFYSTSGLTGSYLSGDKMPKTNCKEILLIALMNLTVNSIVRTDGKIDTAYVGGKNGTFYMGSSNFTIESSNKIVNTEKYEKLPVTTDFRFMQKLVDIYDIDTVHTLIENAVYDSGTYFISFDEFYGNYRITGATLIDRGVHFVKFKVTNNSTTVNLTASWLRTYKDDPISMNLADAKNVDFSGDWKIPFTKTEGENVLILENWVVKTFPSLHMCFRARNGYTYYNNCFKLSTQIIFEPSNLDKMVGPSTVITTNNNNRYKGVITYADIDVKNGLLSNIEMICEKQPLVQE